MDGVHVVTGANRHLYADALEQSYRLRYRVYVEELKWRGLPKRVDGREIDQFDTDETVNLLYLEDDKVVGGTRLVPTTGPHLLSEVFPHFASVRGVPRARDIAEWTRFYVAPERREEHKASRVGSIVLASMIEYALQEGLSAISVLMNVFWLSRFQSYGWRVQPLGLPQEHDGEWLLAARIDINPKTLSGIRKKCALGQHSSLVRSGPYKPIAGKKRMSRETPFDEGPGQSEIVLDILRNSPDPARLMEVFYISLEQGLLHSLRWLASLPDDAHKRLADFIGTAEKYDVHVERRDRTTLVLTLTPRPHRAEYRLNPPRAPWMQR